MLTVPKPAASAENGAFRQGCVSLMVALPWAASSTDQSVTPRTLLFLPNALKRYCPARVYCTPEFVNS